MKLKGPKSKVLPVATTVLALPALACGGELLLNEFGDDTDAATRVNADVNSGGQYYISMTNTASSGVKLNVTPSESGEYAYAKDTITTKTNVPSGYKLYASMNNDDATGFNNLIHNQYSTSVIPSVTSTFADPDVLGDNTWGYAIKKNTAIGANNFDTDYSNPTPTSKWAHFNKISSPDLIQQTSIADTSGVDMDVYYAAKINTNKESGIYSRTVVYTAVASADPTEPLTISPSSGTKGTDIIIRTPFITTSTALGTIEVKVGGQSCDGTPTLDMNGNQLKIICKVPDLGVAGKYNVSVSIPKFGRSYISDQYNQFEYIVSNVSPSPSPSPSPETNSNGGDSSGFNSAPRFASSSPAGSGDGEVDTESDMKKNPASNSLSSGYSKPKGVRNVEDTTEEQTDNMNWPAIIAIVVAGVLTLTAIFFLLFWKRRKDKEEEEEGRQSNR